MYAERHIVPVTTDGSGNATVYTGYATGAVLTIIYTKNNFSAGVDFAITADQSGLNIWTENDVNASKTVHPRVAAATAAGVASTLTEVPLCVANERVKIVISSGGAATTGTFQVIVGG